MQKTFLVTISYDEDENSPHEFSDESLAHGLKFITEASFSKPVDVNARRAYSPAEIEEPKTVVLH
jgi:hypothetical protein